MYDKFLEKVKLNVFRICTAWVVDSLTLAAIASGKISVGTFYVCLASLTGVSLWALYRLLGDICDGVAVLKECTKKARQ